MRVLACVCVCVCVWVSISTCAAEPTGLLRSTTDFGGIGLMQTPTARFGADGEMRLGISTVSPYNRGFFTVQALPWVEATLRYTEVENRLYGPESFSGDQSYKDRGVDLKFKLFGETKRMPQLALGFRDIGGTGLFGSEYLVASKRYYDWDFSLGMGWGYLGNREHFKNPFCVVSDRTCTDRPPGNAAGEWNLKDLFRGRKVALFGGVEYHTPIEGLRFMAEYDSNDYGDREPLNNPQDVDSPINVGLTYRLFNWLDVAVGYERGNTFMAQVVARANFNTDQGVPKFDPPPVQVVPRPSAEKTVATGDSESAAPEPLQATAVAGRNEPTGGEEPGRVAGGRDGLRAGAGASRPAVAAVSPGGTVADRRREENRLAAERITGVLEKLEFQVDAVDVTDWEVTAYVTQGRYRQLPRAAGRAARIMANHAPASVELITVVNMDGGIEGNRTTVWRQDLEKAARDFGSAEEVWANAELEALDGRPASTAVINPDRYPLFGWSVAPGLRQQIGGPDSFYFWALLVRLVGELQISKGLSVTGSLHFNVVDNLDGLQLESDSKLPRVRSDIKHYLKQGKTGITRLQTDYLWKPAPNWYARLSGGLFEEMFGGVGGEILYRRWGSRWAVGADLNWVKQRDFDQLFSFRDYDVVTGHGSVYYDMPFHNLLGVVSVGRYLAGDRGVTFDLSRRFDNGTRVGGFMTFTNVSSEEFGEGSFDKGIYVSVPLELFFTRSGRSYGGIVWRPVTRDGGQRLAVGKRLYGFTEDSNLGAMGRDWNRFFD